MGEAVHIVWLALPWLVAYAAAFWWAMDAELQYLCFKDTCPPRRRVALAITSFGMIVLLPRWPRSTLRIFYFHWRYPILTGKWIPKAINP